MLFLILISILIVLSVGLVTKFIFDEQFKLPVKIKKMENVSFLITSLIISLLILPLAIYGGWTIGKNSKLTFNENWNGWEKEAIFLRTQCERDGACEHTYDCDPYIVMVPYSCGSSKYPATCYRPETRYHQCPYETEEWSFYVNTTLGKYAISTHRFPDNPLQHVWRRGEYPSQYEINYAGVGIPIFWAAVKARLDSGYPGPVTMVRDYKNYILASDNTILKKYDGDIVYFGNLIPSPVIKITNFYQAKKVYYIGYKPINDSIWQNKLSYLNGSLGHDLEGDMRVIIVHNDKISNNLKRYANALQASWQSWKLWKEDAISKNSLILILGTNNDSTISWTQSFTGMPIGNELLLESINSDLIGKPLTPDIFSVIVNDSLKIVSSGQVANIAINSSDTKFKRQHMKGYEYLRGEIQPTKTAKVWTLIIATILGCLCWIAPIAFTEHEEIQNENRNYYFN